MRVQRILQWLALAIAVVASLAPIAHVLELANKMRLDGPLWLDVQQHLYKGWGPFLGGPAEIGGLVLGIVLVLVCWRQAWLRRRYIVATFAYAVMLAAFFVFNDPVNRAVLVWTAQTVPQSWPRYRLQWESGHAIACAFGLISVFTTASAILQPRRPTADAGSDPEA